MGCCGEREKYGNVKNEQKWEYINLNDFQSTSCGTYFSYFVVWWFLVISLGVYAIDLWTASNLLFFDRWSGQVKPVIPFNISRWIFAGCIILSWVLLIYRWWRAIRAIKNGAIGASYLDPLAVRVQSIRMGKEGRGWRRFLVFAALTKGRKGAEYVALFTYFTFEAWLRIVFAEGPRQVINALTLYSVLQAKLIPEGHNAPNDGHTPVVQFFVNIQILANQNKQQAVILFGMLYTLVIWVFSAFSLAAAIVFYIFFLWHHIPSSDGGLSEFCRRKIDKRLHKIVMNTVNTALAKEDKKRALNDLAKVGVAGTATSDVKRQPTVPNLESDAEPSIPALSRHTTQDIASPFGTRPASPFSARPASPFGTRPSTPTGTINSASALGREPTVPSVLGNGRRPQAPSRQPTNTSMNSDASYASDAPLMSQASNMGYGGRGDSHNGSRVPSRMDSERTFHSAQSRPPGRTFTGSSRGTQGTQQSYNSRMGPPRRTNTDMSNMSSMTGGSGIPSRDASLASSNRRSPPGGPPNLSRQPAQEFEMHPPSSSAMNINRPPPNGPPPHGPLPGPPSASMPYKPFTPGGPSSGVPLRNFTAPFNQPPPRSASRQDYFGDDRPAPPQRSGTAPIPNSGGYAPPGRNSPAPFRPATAQGGERPGPPPGGYDGPRPGPPGGAEYGGGYGRGVAF